jgi:hypothetical protein
VFLKDTTTRRIVLADSIGPLVTARSTSEQWPDAAAGAPPPPPPPPLGGPPAYAVAGTLGTAAAIAIAAANLATGVMILHLLLLPDAVALFNSRAFAAHIKHHSADKSAT